MKFQYHNPIRFQFGEDAFEKLPELCRGHRVMLVYGGGSIKKNGVYDRITGLLNKQAIPYVDYGGQKTATYQGILDGIALAKQLQVDTVIEVGGASAMDTGKAIAFGAVHDNLEDYIEGRETSDNRHLFNIVIPTYPSTGSEANGVCDIMEYKGGGAELFGAWPDYCLMVPSATRSLDKKNTAYSALVCFIQTSCWYIGNHENPIAKGFAKTVLQILLSSLDRLLKNPEDQQARENLMWASCVNTMGIFRSGVDHFYPWTLYSVGYIPRVAHGVSYREALVIAYPAWLKGISRYHMEDIRTLFTEIFGLSSALEDRALVEQGCGRLKAIMEESGIPMTLSAYGECPAKDYIEQSLVPEDFGEFTPEEMHQMVAECYR